MDKSSHPPAYHVGQDAGPPPVIVGQPQPYATPQQGKTKSLIGYAHIVISNRNIQLIA